MVADGTTPPRTDPASISEQDQPSFAEVGRNLGTAWAAAQTYLAAQVARLRVAIRNFVLLAIFGAFAAVIALTILISSTVLLVIGSADAIASLLGGRQWAGDLIVGLVVVMGAVLAAFLVVRIMLKAFIPKPRKPSAN